MKTKALFIMISRERFAEHGVFCFSSPYSVDEASLAQLLHLHKRLMATRDSCRLQKVVDILETTGAYSISDATLDFDLCALDIPTIKKIESCLER